MSTYKNIEMLPIEDIASKYLKIVRKFVFIPKKLNTYITQSNCDIVHIHGFMSIGIVQAINAAHKQNKKIIYSPHFHPFKYLRNPLLGKLFFYLILKPILHKIDTIITINKEDSAFFKRYHSKVIQIPHWSNISQSHINLPKQKDMILFIGRNDSNKGLEHLYNLPTHYQVHCVTKGPLKRKDFILHERLSDSELSLLYQKASIVVVPSKYEAFSLVALEALSYHTPIVISNRVRIADYLTGDSGYSIFKYHDYTDFNNAICKTLQMNNINFKQLLLPFRKENIQEKYYQVYNN